MKRLKKTLLLNRQKINLLNILRLLRNDDTKWSKRIYASLNLIPAIAIAVISYYQLSTSRKQNIIISKQTEIINQQTLLMEKQKEIARLQYENNVVFNEAQLKLANKQVGLLSLQTDMSIEPNIKIKLVSDAYNNKYSLIIINEGTNDISDIKIIKRHGIYNLNKIEKSSFIVYSKYWLMKDKLKFGDSIVTQIPFDDIKHTWQMYKNPSSLLVDSLDKEYLLPSTVFKIKYLRQSDKKSYLYSKILLMLDATFDNYGKKIKTIMLYDPDDNEGIISKEQLSVLKQYEKVNNWILPKFDY